MKIFFLSLALLSSLSSFAAEVDVLNAELAVEDEAGNKQLCLTVVRIPKTGETMGIVETLYDCFYGRQAKKKNAIDVDLKKLTKPEPSLLRHLQNRDPSLEFRFSDGE